jgi:hypothetical protein
MEYPPLLDISLWNRGKLSHILATRLVAFNIQKVSNFTSSLRLFSIDLVSKVCGFRLWNGSLAQYPPPPSPPCHWRNDLWVWREKRGSLGCGQELIPHLSSDTVIVLLWNLQKEVQFQFLIFLISNKLHAAVLLEVRFASLDFLWSLKVHHHVNNSPLLARVLAVWTQFISPNPGFIRHILILYSLCQGAPSGFSNQNFLRVSHVSALPRQPHSPRFDHRSHIRAVNPKNWKRVKKEEVI